MSSRSHEARDQADASPVAESHPAERTLTPLLDATFGLFVWMAQLVTVYVVAALACGLGLVDSSGRGSRSLVTALGIVTLVAAIVVALHAVHRWRRQRALPDRRFRMVVTVGCDAIAVVAIAWQLLAIGLVPTCS